MPGAQGPCAVLSRLFLSSKSKARAVPMTTVVTGLLPWVLGRQLSKDGGSLITEKFDPRG